jgi:hypothetical protein
VLRAVAADGEASGSLFLAIHRALSRRDFVASAKGAGVEIGPGAQPQILPADDVQARYLEQMHPEKWNALYNGGGKYPVRPELWDNYIVGDASNLPCDDGSLDFIFSSHVFEHLSNPIGHLRHWVVPDLGGSKDYFQQPSELAELAPARRPHPGMGTTSNASSSP